MKRLLCTLLAVLMLFSVSIPQNVQASAKVKVKYNGVTKSYSKKKTYLYIDGKKKNIPASPIFEKSGCYVGPLAKIFLKSSLKVKYKQSGKKITLTYKKNKLTLTDGSTDVVLNGKKQKNALLAAPMKAARYSNTKVSRWIVPIRSVCIRLGINYQLKNGVISIGRLTASSKSAAVTTTQKTTSTTAGKTATTAKKTATSTTAKKSLTAVTTVAGSSSSTTASKTSTVPAAGKIVLVLDPGHGGIDSGAVGNGYREKDFTLAIVKGAKKYFDSDTRFKVYYTRTADTYPSLGDRCKLANGKSADLFISVHINSASATARGTETLYNNSRNATTKKNGITSRDLAYAMHTAAIKTTGFPNRGLVNRTGLWVLNRTNMPACLIEYGFISNSTEAKKMHANTSRYGQELYQAIVNYLKTQKKIS